MKNLRCCFIGILLLTMLFGQTSMAATDAFSSAVDNCHATYFPTEGKLLIPCMYAVDAMGNMQAHEAIMEQISTSYQWQFVVKQVSASQDDLIAENVPSCRAVYLTEYGRLLIPCVDVVDLSGKVESSHQAMMEQLPATVVELPRFVVTEVDGDSTQESLRSGLRGLFGGVVGVNFSGSGSGLVTSDVSGISCRQNCQKFFDDLLVTLRATPVSGSKFVGWSGPCLNGVSANWCMVKTNKSQAQVVTVKFGKNVQPQPPVTGSTPQPAFTLQPALTPDIGSTPQPSITGSIQVVLSGDGKGQVTSNPSGVNCTVTGSSSCQIKVKGTITLTATPATGSIFGGWSGACTGTSSSCVLTPGSRSLVTTATFKKKSTPQPIPQPTPQPIPQPIQTKYIPLGDPIPEGWLKTRLNGWNCIGVRPNCSWTISRYDNLPIGSTMVVCPQQTEPSGWIEIARDVIDGAGPCSDSANGFIARDAMITIKRFR